MWYLYGKMAFADVTWEKQIVGSMSWERSFHKEAGRAESEMEP
jgi:hypothetical protein